MRKKGIILFMSVSVVAVVWCLIEFKPSNAPISTVPQNQPVNNKILVNYMMPSLDTIQSLLKRDAPSLNENVVRYIITVLKCTETYHVPHNNILTIIDYSMPANQKRLWVFDLEKNQLLFNTYVSHGIKSGELSSHYFSNRFDSKASSIGVYTTENSYRGRHGLSLRLQGLDNNFNNNAYGRYIVMHGSWYVEETFIKKYGRPGRSWGCPAVPSDLTQSIIDTIKNNSLLIAYYPDNTLINQSKFLNCQSPKPTNAPLVQDKKIPDLQRESVVFTDRNKNNRREESEAVLTVSADNYQRIFNTTAPLQRMLRRKINDMEYIALDAKELEKISQNHDEVFLVVPEVKMDRGYWATEMKIIAHDKIKSIKPMNNSEQRMEIYFENKPPMQVKSSDAFIRWLGL